MSLPICVKNDPRYSHLLRDLSSLEDIPLEWRNTPIENLIASENFQRAITPSDRPQLLIGTCIEFRYALPVPRMYAYVIRRASGRLIGSEFSIAYTLAQGVRHIALIGHNDCGMTKVRENMDIMVSTLIEQGWDRERAEEYFNQQAGRHIITDELQALEREYRRLTRLFKNVTIAPLFVCLADTKLHLPKWYHRYCASVASADTAAEEGSCSVADADILSLG